MDLILNPRTAPRSGQQAGMAEDFLDVATL
jgi:hypothetical protein